MPYERREGESIPAFAAFLLFAHLPPEEVNFNGQRIDRFAAIANAIRVNVIDVLAWRSLHEWEARKSGGFRRPPPDNVTLPRAEALLKVLDARADQRQRWGEDHDREHTDGDWLALFVARIGKFSMAYLNGHVDLKQKRAAQLGALCLAYLESRE